LLTNPKIQKAVSGRSRTEAEALLNTLVRRGFKRLSDEQLLQQAVIRGGLLASIDVTTCAPIVRDTATTAQINRALAKLEDAEVEKFLALKEAAVLAEVAQKQPPAFAQETEFPAAFGARLEALPREQADYLAMLLSGDPSRASNDDLCWAERTQYGDRLVCIRYRDDDIRQKQLKTVELIVEEEDWAAPNPSHKKEDLVHIALIGQPVKGWRC
jgi:hypothetical protein